MTPPSNGGAVGPPGPPDRQTLRLLERQFASDSIVAAVAFDPDTYEPRRLEVQVDEDQYPDSVVAARVDVRWFTTGDFSFHYVESHADEARWECRWDRHPNGHNSRVHFHEPPFADDASDLSLPSLHPLDVYSTVLDAVEERIESLWSA